MEAEGEASPPAKDAAQPAIHYAASQSFLKGEDVVLTKPLSTFPGLTPQLGQTSMSTDGTSVHDSVTTTGNGDSLPARPGPEAASSADGTPTTYGLFGIFDGHNGAAAAQHTADTLWEVLHEKLPRGRPPRETDTAAYRTWREALQWALVLALDDIQQTFACNGVAAGTTVTVVLQVGWLLTVASVGDSRAVLDTGLVVLPLSVDHRVATHKEERRRLVKQGAHIAPIHFSGRGPAADGAQGHGPLRVWPGGLCLSRSLGDFDVGPVVMALPHIMQVKVPRTGGRVLVASDGVWDAFEQSSRVSKLARRWSSQAVPENVTAAIKRALGGLKDDTSVIVIDVLPPGARDFPSVPSAVEDAEPERRLEAPEILADIDVVQLAGLMPGPVPYVPGWFQAEEGARLVRSQEEACKAWREACTWVQIGKSPSRANLASFFSQAELRRPAEEEYTGKAIPEAYHGLPPTRASPREQGEEPAKSIHPAFGGVLKPKRPVYTDFSVKAGTAYVPEKAAPPSTPLSPLSTLPEVQDPSVRFSSAVAASDKSYAQQFGAYRHDKLIPDVTVHNGPAEVMQRASMSLQRAEDDVSTHWSRESNLSDANDASVSSRHSAAEGGPPRRDSMVRRLGSLSRTGQHLKGSFRSMSLGGPAGPQARPPPGKLPSFKERPAPEESGAPTIEWGGVVEASRRPSIAVSDLQSIAEKGARGGSGSLFAPGEGPAREGPPSEGPTGVSPPGEDALKQEFKRRARERRESLMGAGAKPAGAAPAAAPVEQAAH